MSIADMRRTIADIRRIYPHLAGADDATVSAFAQSIAHIDAIMPGMNIVHILLSGLPNGFIEKCLSKGKNVLSFNFRTEEILLQWLLTREASVEISSQTWEQYDSLKIMSHKHKEGIDKCRSNKKVACMILRTVTAVYCSARIEL